MSSLRAQSTWWDGLGDYKRPCTLSLGPQCSVRGGRLGRDRTLEDVPNHYVRDCLMGYIAGDDLAEDLRQPALEAVFPDLTPAEREEYDTILKEQRKERENEVRAMQTAPKAGGKRKSGNAADGGGLGRPKRTKIF